MTRTLSLTLGCAALVGLLSSCVSLPEHQDPLAGLRPAASAAQNPYKKLALGVILSENSKKTAEYMERWQKRFRVPVDVEAIFGEVLTTLQNNFKSAVRLDKLEDAGAAQVDLTAVLDITAKMPGSIFEDKWFDARVVLLAPDGARIDAVAGRTDNFIVPDPKGGRDGLRLGAAEASRKLEAALLSSGKATAFAAARAGGPKTAVAETPARPAALEPRTVASDVDGPAFSPRDKALGEADLAVVIGVERYQDLPAADYAAGDARLVKEYLLALGLKERNIQLLVDEKATQSSIKKTLETWLANRVKKESRLIVYYSGHGSPDPATGAAYLVPHDGDPNYLADTGYPLQQLYAKLGALPAAETVVLLDACFSGAGGRSVLAKGARPLVVAQAGAALPPNLLVLAATQGAQISTSAAEKGHGLFTYHFLKALKDGKKDVVEIFQHISPLVEDDAKALNVSQTPSLSPEGRPARTRFRLRN